MGLRAQGSEALPIAADFDLPNHITFPSFDADAAADLVFGGRPFSPVGDIADSPVGDIADIEQFHLNGIDAGRPNDAIFDDYFFSNWCLGTNLVAVEGGLFIESNKWTPSMPIHTLPFI